MREDQSQDAGGGLFTRMLRGSVLVGVSYLGSLAIRLGSNLILTRLLWPEAFGLMTLVSIVLIGLTMFSDVGLGPAIQSHARGDDPGFLNTAFTLQLIRGVVLAVICATLGGPMARLYGAPELALLLPVAGLQLLIAGAAPIRIESANRHLRPGRVMASELMAQVVGFVVMVGAALGGFGVWSLIWGTLSATLFRVGLCHIWLPGQRERLALEPAACRILLRYGVWIFLSTACGFLLAQGDKAILGFYLSLETLGIYNVGYFLASFPMLLAGAVTGRLLVSLYARVREAPDPGSARRLRQMRYALTTVIFTLLAVMALAGPWVVGLLYDERYQGAGAVVVMVTLVQLPQLMVMTLDPAALSFGRSRDFFAVTALRAAVQTAFLLIGAQLGGLAGALCGQLLAGLLVMPASFYLAHKNGVLDPRHDALFGLLCLVLAGLVLWIFPDLRSALEAF